MEILTFHLSRNNSANKNDYIKCYKAFNKINTLRKFIVLFSWDQVNAVINKKNFIARTYRFRKKNEY